MKLQTLIITSENIRRVLQPTQTFNCFVVLSYAFFFLAAYGLCSTNGIQNPPEEHDGYASFGKSYNLGFPGTIVGDTSFGYEPPLIHRSSGSVCPDNHLFCFPSALSGFNLREKSITSTSVDDSGCQYNGLCRVGLDQDIKQGSNISWFSDYGLFKLLSGGVASCSLNSRQRASDVPSLQTEGVNNDISCCGRSLLKKKTPPHSLSKHVEMSKSSSFDGSSSPSVRIDPTVLDWGQEYLYSPSIAFLNVTNECKNSILHLYEPFSNDLQFYPCNFSEVSLGPGESALICFVFFPRCLGLSSADLILQTSSGGFIIEAKGYATKSPFGLQSLVGLEIAPGGRLSKNFILSNPFDETIFVEEITASVSVSAGHSFIETEAISGVHNFQVFDNIISSAIKNLLVVKSSHIGSPLIAIKPHRNWEIGPHSSETIMDIDITVGLEGKIFGAFCLHLRRYSQGMSDTIVVPIEAEMDSHFGNHVAVVHVSATLEGLAACEGGGSVITISLRNFGSCVLSFVKAQVSDTEPFHIKYMDGLLLFPGTVTQVGFIYCNILHINLQDMPPKVSNLQENCKLVILTNDSISPKIEIMCEDILHVCFEHQRHLSVEVGQESKVIESGNMGARSEDRNRQPPQNVKVIETADLDELVLQNWMSQGTTTGMSVLEDHEGLFPTVQVGSYVSRWITVKNPSQHPVMVQLILNPGEIIDECRGPNNFFCPSSSGLVLDEATTPAKYGFSVPDSAVTEAYLHPYDNLTLGPIIFYPSKLCGWTGSALIRNNLSGVEWIPLRGFGGLLSLVLLERSEHVHSINFDLKMPETLNLALPCAFSHMKAMASACSQPLMKELYVKNTGDLPLEVKTVRVSGRECGLDGFKIHACNGFVLQPGESTKLWISYQTNFSAAIVYRDLELTLATGIFLIPMKASFTYDVQSNCKKSIFWMRVKKWVLGYLLVASLILLVFCFIFHQTVRLGNLDYSCKSDDNSIRTTTKFAGKSPLLHCDQKKNKLSMSSKINNLFCSVEKDTTSTMQASWSRYSYGCGQHSEHEISKHLIQASENHRQSNHLLDTRDGIVSPPTEVQSSDTIKASSQLDNLMVKTGKEKSRRRKKKSLGAKLASLSEVSSSHSGNSTPSPPLSPAISAALKSNWPLSPGVEQPYLEAHRLVTQVPAQNPYSHKASASTAKTNVLEPKVPVKLSSNKKVPSSKVPHSVSTNAATIPVKIPPALRPLPDKPSTFSWVRKSTVTVVARAPGLIVEKQKDGVEAPKVGVADEYAYDIWGDHLSWIHLLNPKNVTSMKSIPAEKNFDSFFVKGPLTLVTNSQAG